MDNVNSSANGKASLRSRLIRWAWRIAIPAAGVLVIAFLMARRGTETEERGTTFPVRRGPLRITVLEGGSIEALESQEIKSEVKGQTKILSIVEEGYMVTQEDVEAKKTLVELDASELLDHQISQELDYQNALAAFTEATEQFEIQLNQNRSDIRAAELEVKFGRMDFEKYLGIKAAREILAQVPQPEEGTNPQPAAARVEPEAEFLDTPTSADDGATQMAAEIEKRLAEPQAHVRPVIDFSTYADPDMLGDGEAGQRLRKLENDLVMAREELGLAEANLEGTERLAAKQFVTKTELENEQLKVKGSKISVESAETSMDLYVRYEFLKESEQLLSDYEEALQKLERARKLAVSKLAQSEAKLRSTEARYTLQAQKRNEIQEQIEKCKLAAERPGLVVYGGGEERYFRGEDQIEEGATVRERQKIITIPDMTQMSVKVKVHESAIKNVEKGQKASVSVDAYPDKHLGGEVTKVAVLPDSQNRWMNPDVKVYETVIRIEGPHDWLKPGMSAQVEILVKELPDVLYVPIQSVAPSNGQRVCYVAGLGGPKRRVVETGEYNNEFIEIRKGLEEGEDVLLRAPTEPEEAEQAPPAPAGPEDPAQEPRQEQPREEATPRPPAPPEDTAERPPREVGGRAAPGQSGAQRLPRRPAEGRPPAGGEGRGAPKGPPATKPAGEG